ncbi:FeoA family protein [Paenibacillus sanguinis]|uniref:FeoA family protein n=1 Tax=Paenibacillus sanguinis TaxID=225906 RepID=UPI000361DAF8|nr:FeoA family protein [Paenibacillus sanguinis]
MPLTMLPPGQEAIIRECKASDATRKFLEGLGIVPGASITVVNETGGNLIVNVKGSRLALSKAIAGHLYISLTR